MSTPTTPTRGSSTFAGEDVGNLSRRLDVVEVPAALRGQAREQLFVEVGADAEGGGRDALGAQQHAFHASAGRICGCSWCAPASQPPDSFVDPRASMPADRKSVV